jgi:cytochrome c oxidase subunit 2
VRLPEKSSGLAVRRLRRLLSLAGLGVIAASAVSCPGALDPHGPQSGRIADLAWVLFGISFVIFLLVMAILWRALVRKPKPSDDESKQRMWLIGGGGLVLPAIVLFGVIGYTTDTLHFLTKPAPPDALQINITGHDFWWDVEYPDENVRTANEIHIPVDETISVTGATAVVIHSFWAPQLNGKFDFVSGRTTTFTLHADKVGTYRGQCAEFCGLSHANMAFYLIVQSRDDFNAWIQSQQQPPAAVTDARTEAGRQVFFGSSCASCHGLQPDQEGEVAAPNLAHLAARNTIAGATLQLNADNLEQWIRDPTSIKPGAQMPSFSKLSNEDMTALVQFLMSLN